MVFINKKKKNIGTRSNNSTIRKAAEDDSMRRD